MSIKDTKETPDSLKFLQYLYAKGNEENLKFYISVNLKQNKDVFYQAVMSNKKQLVKKILSYAPEYINYTNSEGYLSFTHPTSNEVMEFSCDLPEDMEGITLSDVIPAKAGIHYKAG